MSTTEALRTQLDAVQTDLYRLQSKNRKLREAEPQQAQLLDVEGELAQTREENVHLAQQISKLQVQLPNVEGELAHTREENVRLAQQISELNRSAGDDEQEQSLKETIATLRQEAEERECQLEKSRVAVSEVKARASEAEQEASRAGERLYCVQEQAELERLRAIADVTRRWEKREARLVRRLEELERNVKSGSSHTTSRVNAREGRGASTADSTKRYVTIVSPVGHDVGGDRGETPDSDNQVIVQPHSQQSASGGSTVQTTAGGSPAVVHSPTNIVPGPLSGAGCELNANASVFRPIQNEQNIVPAQGQTLESSQSGENGAAVVPVPILAATPLDTLSMALLAQQLPSLPNFSGENMEGDGEFR